MKVPTDIKVTGKMKFRSLMKKKSHKRLTGMMSLYKPEKDDEEIEHDDSSSDGEKASHDFNRNELGETTSKHKKLKINIATEEIFNNPKSES